MMWRFPHSERKGSCINLSELIGWRSWVNSKSFTRFANTIIKYTCVYLKYHKFPSLVSLALLHIKLLQSLPCPLMESSFQKTLLYVFLVFLAREFLMRTFPSSAWNYFKTVFLYLRGKFMLRYIRFDHKMTHTKFQTNKIAIDWTTPGNNTKHQTTLFNIESLSLVCS